MDNTIEPILKKADEALGLKDYDNALKYYNEVLKLDPDNYTAHYGKLNCLYDQGSYNVALEYYEKMLATNPNNVSYLHDKAYCLYQMHKYSAALKCHEKVIEISPNDPASKNWIEKIKEEM